nr:hypothetical protein [Natronorubrum texcoconense]
MRSERHSNRASTSSRMRRALESVLLRSEGRTVIEECRRCGTTLETGGPSCPACGRDDIVKYHLE